MPLLTLDEAKAALNIAVTTYDDELQDYIDGSIEAVEFICGPSATTPVTEVVVVTGTEIPLGSTPVISVTSVTGDLFGVVDPTTYRVAADSGVIRAKGNALPLQPDTYTVVYSAGRAVAPKAMKQAAKVILKHQWSTQRGPQARAVIDDATMVSGLGYALPNAALQMLTPHALGPAVG